MKNLTLEEYFYKEKLFKSLHKEVKEVLKIFGIKMKRMKLSCVGYVYKFMYKDKKKNKVFFDPVLASMFVIKIFEEEKPLENYES